MSVISEIVRNDGSVDVCLEEFKEGIFCEVIGWVIISCINVKLISFVISVLINIVVYFKEDENNIEKVLKGIIEIYFIV